MPQVCPRCQARVGGKSIRCPECGTTLEEAAPTAPPVAKSRPRVVEATAPAPAAPLFLDQAATEPAPVEPEPAPAPLFDEPAAPGRRAVVPPPRPPQPLAPPIQQRVLTLPPAEPTAESATATALEEPEAATVEALAAQGVYEGAADVQGWVARMLSGATDPPATPPLPEAAAETETETPDTPRYLPAPDPPMIFYPMLAEPDDDWSDNAFPPRPSISALDMAAVPEPAGVVAFPGSSEALQFLREELADAAPMLPDPAEPELRSEPEPAAESAPEPEVPAVLARLDVLDDFGEWVDWGDVPAAGRVVGRAGVAADLPGAETLAAEHFSLRYEDSVLVVEDFDSADGVYRRITEPVALEDGQRFRIGGYVLEFRVAEEAPPTVPLASEQRGTLCCRDLAALAYVDLVRPDGTVGLRFPISKRDATVIGREGPSACVALVGDATVSTSHAQIRLRADGFVLEDLKSRGGTFVQIQHPTPLRAGDVLQAGKLLFRVAEHDVPRLGISFRNAAG